MRPGLCCTHPSLKIEIYLIISNKKNKQTNKQNEDIKPKKVLKKKYYLYPESMKYGKKSNFYLGKARMRDGGRQI